MSAQLDFGGATTISTSIIGLIVETPKPCRACGCVTTAVGSSKAMHHASLWCTGCDRFTGWMSGASYKFIAEILEHCGRPTEPIIVRIGASS